MALRDASASKNIAKGTTVTWVDIITGELEVTMLFAKFTTVEYLPTMTFLAFVINLATRYGN